MALNYAQLTATLQSYLEDDIPKDILDTIIRQAEERIYNSVQLPVLRRNRVGTTTAANPYLTLPGDWLATYAVMITVGGVAQYLRVKDMGFLREMYPSTTPGVPKFYTQYDATTLMLAPTPGAAYQVELHYLFRPESIVTAGTSWLGDNFESALLYGCLVEGYTYMKGDASLLGTYDAKYKEAMTLLKQLGDGKNRQDTYRTEQVRYPVG